MSHHWDELSKSLAEKSLPRRESLQRLAVALASLAFLVLAPADVARAQSNARRHRDVTVMTRNLYVGADLTQIVQQPTPANVEATFARVELTDFPARAEAIADEVAAALLFNHNNCGACNNQCPGGTACSFGTCVGTCVGCE